ncbi:MAG TPA: DinB family protein [Methylomirabilota bacterium]|jgi:hypothetical protein|nr:DinB family protein [Methylomirabilota bacterium]
MSDDPMAREDEQAKLRSYLAGQSAKLSAGEIRQRIEDAADEFFGAVGGVTDAAAHTPPTAGEWSVAEILDHVTLTLEDATAIMRTLAAGKPARALRDHRPRPAEAAASVAELLARLRRNQAALSDFLAACSTEPHTFGTARPGRRGPSPATPGGAHYRRVAEPVFGEINWKGYALILRLHYRDHAQQVRTTLAAVTPGAG